MLKGLSKILFIVTLIFSFSAVSAQYQANGIVVKMNPDNPISGDTISLVISSTQVDLNTANIIWKLNQGTQQSAVGKKSFSFIGGQKGNPDIVEITIVPEEGNLIKKMVNVDLSEVDLIWEVLDGYVPSFYKGKILPIDQSQVRVVVIPQIRDSSSKLINKNNLVYFWQKDGKNQSGYSGYGKDSMIFSNNYLEQTNTVNVDVNNQNNTAESAIVLSYFEPEILFYENDTIKGPNYNKIIKNRESINQSKISILAEPYFLSNSFFDNSTIDFNWKINGQSVSAQTKNNLIINTSSIEGNLNIEVEYNDTQKLFRTFKKFTSLIVR